MKHLYLTLSLFIVIITTAGAQPAKLMINEVNPNIGSSRDLIELLVKKSGQLRGFTIEQGLSSSVILATLPALKVSAGDIIVVHLNPDATLNGDAFVSETQSIGQCPNSMYPANYDGAWDVHGGTTGITFTNRVLVIRDSLGNIQDAVPFTNGGSTPSAFPPDLQNIQAQSLWLPANCGGVNCDYTSTPGAQAISVSWLNAGTTRTGNSVQRKYSTDANINTDWTSAPTSPTFGALNAGQTTCTSTSSTINPKACYTYTSPSGYYKWTGSGTYTDIISNHADCDSILTINLTINVGTTGSIVASVCKGESYLFNGQNLNTDGTYYDTLTNKNNCDSILQLNLKILPVQTTTVDTTVMTGSNYTLPSGKVVSSPGTYRDTLAGSNTCDSIVITHLYYVSSFKGLTAADNIILYPQPAARQLFISLPTNIAEINLYSITGQLMLHIEQPQNNSIDVSQFFNGVYLAEIRTDNVVVWKKWTKV